MLRHRGMQSTQHCTRCNRGISCLFSLLAFVLSLAARVFIWGSELVNSVCTQLQPARRGRARLHAWLAPKGAYLLTAGQTQSAFVAWFGYSAVIHCARSLLLAAVLSSLQEPTDIVVIDWHCSQRISRTWFILCHVYCKTICQSGCVPVNRFPIHCLDPLQPVPARTCGMQGMGYVARPSIWPI